MKKSKVFLATAVVMLAAWSLAKAVDGPQFGTPRGGPQALASADYGGVFMSVATFPFNGGSTGVNFSTVAIPSVAGLFNRGVFYGILFSSGTGADFVDVFDSTSSDRAKIEGAVARIYNVGSSTGGANAYATGFSGLDKPFRFNKGLIIRASRGDLNHTNTLYMVEPTRQ